MQKIVASGGKKSKAGEVAKAGNSTPTALMYADGSDGRHPSNSPAGGLAELEANQFHDDSVSNVEYEAEVAALAEAKLRLAEIKMEVEAQTII